MARVSVLLPVYNGEAYLAEALQSIIAQDYHDFDIHIIDDGSTDTTADIIDKLKDNRLNYHKIKNIRIVGALNYGLKLLDCEFVARMDADDISFPFRLSRQVDFLKFTQAVATSSRVININAAGRITSLSGDNTDFLNFDPKAIPAKEPYLPHPFMMVRLDIMRDIGGYRLAHLAEDSDLCWRLADTYRVALQSDVMGLYRSHSSNSSNEGLTSGYIQAFYSELAALNAARRQDKQTEVPYHLSPNDISDMTISIKNLTEAHTPYLSPVETNHLMAAASIKLLDISTYRYLPLSKEDIKFAKNCLAKIKLTKRDKQNTSRIFQQVREFHPELHKINWRKTFFK